MAIRVTLEEIRAAGQQDWRLDNTALKSIRFQCESPPGTPLDWSGVDLTHSDPYPALRVRRDNGASIFNGRTTTAMVMAVDVESLR